MCIGYCTLCSGVSRAHRAVLSPIHSKCVPWLAAQCLSPMPKFSNRVNWINDDGSSAWDIHYAALAAAQDDRDILVLSVGDPDFATPAPIIEALISAATAGKTHYTPILGTHNLRAAVAKQLNQQGATHLNLENIAILAGAQNALFAAAQCTLEPGDEVITFDPAYVTYAATVGAAGAQLVRVPGATEHGFRPNLAALSNAINANTRAILVANPSNPSGVALRREELTQIFHLADQHDLWVWSDEVYAELMFDGQHHSASHFSMALHRTICIGSLSKSHAMTGWRVGWIAGPKELIAHIENLSLCMLYGLPEFIQEAAAYALNNCQQAVLTMRDTYRRRRNLVLQELDGIPELRLIKPEAGMFILMDISATGMTSAAFVAQLYQQHKVALLDGAAFSPSLNNFVRLSFSNSERNLSEACRRIKLLVSNLSARATD